MHENDTVQRAHKPTAWRLLGILCAAVFTAACGGPAGALHDVLDEAQDRVETVLDIFEDTDEAMTAALATELPPCPAQYQPPVLLQNEPPYGDVVETPTALADVDQAEMLLIHRQACAGAAAVLQERGRYRELSRPLLEDFAGYADAMRDFIDDDMSDDDVEQLSAELDAIIEARADDIDTLELRYERLHDRLVDLSPLVREMAHGTDRPASRVNPGGLADMSVRENFEAAAEPWAEIFEAHAAARAFFAIWNDYTRRIYEGPDAEDPDEAAVNWGLITGIWTGEYVQVRQDYNSDGYRVSVGETPRRIRLTLDANGEGTSEYIDSNCGGPLELVQRSGASDRITQYDDRGCSGRAVLTLERTAENRIRIEYAGGMSGRYRGEVTRQ